MPPIPRARVTDWHGGLCTVTSTRIERYGYGSEVEMVTVRRDDGTTTEGARQHFSPAPNAPPAPAIRMTRAEKKRAQIALL